MDSPRRCTILALVDLVCICCNNSGHNQDSYALAQELLPLPMLLKALGQPNGLAMLDTQDALLRSLKSIWWSRELVLQEDVDCNGEYTINCWQDMYWVSFCWVLRPCLSHDVRSSGAVRHDGGRLGLERADPLGAVVKGSRVAWPLLTDCPLQTARAAVGGRVSRRAFFGRVWDRSGR